MTTFINLCPHTINLNDGRAFAPSGVVARVSASFTPFDQDGIATQVFGDVQDLPAPQDGVTYIVSLAVIAAVKGTRNDLVSPATGHPDCKRVDGRIVSVPGFIRG